MSQENGNAENGDWLRSYTGPWRLRDIAWLLTRDRYPAQSYGEPRRSQWRPRLRLHDLERWRCVRIRPEASGPDWPFLALSSSARPELLFENRTTADVLAGIGADLPDDLHDAEADLLCQVAAISQHAVSKRTLEGNLS